MISSPPAAERGEAAIPSTFEAALAVEPITDQEFQLFQTMVRREAGISLSEAKRPLLVGRLSSRIRKLGLKTFLNYYRLVQADSPERVRMFDLISTNETHFFREPGQFAFLEQRVFPLFREQSFKGRRIRVWSAGCSTGEEPYSLAMLLLAHFPTESGYTFEILATDLSTRVLDKARGAVWPIRKSSEIPPAYLRAFMLRGQGPEAGNMMAGPEIRSLIRFERLNFQDEVWKVHGEFDLIFCRNVLIYFDHEGRARVVRRLLERLTEEGHFFMGHAESLDPVTTPVVRAGPVVYRRAHHGRHAPAPVS